jgi:hypothetical protein
MDWQSSTYGATNIPNPNLSTLHSNGWTMTLVCFLMHHWLFFFFFFFWVGVCLEDFGLVLAIAVGGWILESRGR